MKKNNSGQSLIELIIALTIGGIFITAAVSAVYLIIRNNSEVRTNQIATFLAQEYFDNLNTIASSRWLEIYCPPSGVCPGSAKGSSSQFHLVASGTTYAILDGTTSTIIEGKSFSRYFSIENVNRNSCGVGDVTTNSTTTCAMESGSSYVAEDPSAQKITIRVAWGNSGSLERMVYLTRRQNFNFRQTDWSGGDSQENFPTSTNMTMINNRFATSSNINFSAGSIQQISTSTLAWLESSIFNTFAYSGAAINTISWKGSLNGNLSTNVGFQIAAATSSLGPWIYKGPDGTSGTYYNDTADPFAVIPVNLQYNNNYQYFRYKLFILVATAQGSRVDEVATNWSP